MLTEEQNQFDKIFTELSTNLDISESQYNTAVSSYRAVGDYLANKDSELHSYNPTIKPQGSFLLGTMVKPIIKDDEFDVDLVCTLNGIPNYWVQFNLKDKVGTRLKNSPTYISMLEKEKRRCWTLKYSESSKFHMDILPSLIANGYQIMLEKAMIASSFSNYDELSIRITDKKDPNYYKDMNPDNWLKSNPFGYAKWFFDKNYFGVNKGIKIAEAIDPLPSYQKDKTLLQRAIQIFKRHRDIMFEGDDNKPISIIITTLAARAYQEESDLITTIKNIIDRMPNLIEEEFDITLGKYVKYIPNPVNTEENFADKWAENSLLKTNFYLWLERIKKDLSKINISRGPSELKKSFNVFGENIVEKSFANLAKTDFNFRTKGTLTMNTTTGIIGTSTVNSKSVPGHNFHGKTKT
ncbi:MAG: nucleotidyltransferase [Planctomycetia bacterium]|nr:nucleotidyltransferase [Planctomycetia bacterium]